jgi:Protein of unknown function (DUF4054)
MDLADFRMQFPEFASTGDDRINYWLGKALTYVDPTVWGPLSDDGTAYWVAHQIAFGAQNAAAVQNPDEAGAVVLKAGDTTIQYSDKVALAKLTGDSYLSTAYGQYFLQLRRSAGIGIVAV